MDDLEQWIADREVIARSQDCGQDLEQCEVISEHFFCVLLEQLIRVLQYLWYFVVSFLVGECRD